MGFNSAAALEEKIWSNAKAVLNDAPRPDLLHMEW